jgi:MFS family permease
LTDAENHTRPLDGPRLFYGWVIVASVFCMSATAAGIIYAFPAFVGAFEAEFGAGRADVAFAFAISEFVWFMTGFGAGFPADHLCPRKVGLAGALIIAAGLACASQAPSLPLLYLAYGAGVGIGGGMIYVPAVGLVQRWFRKKRGLASGLAICGTGVGTLAFPPLAMAMTEMLGWRGAHLVLAALALLICGAASLMLVAHPRDIGLAPDGGAVDPSADAAAQLPGLTLAEALRCPHFWLLYGASLMSAAAVFINYVHLVPYATDHGVTAQRGILLVGILGISGTVGRFLLGGLADRFGHRHALTLMFGGLALAMLWWLLVAPGFAELAAYAMAFGMLYGGYIALLPALTMEYFGGRRIATIIGALYTSWGIGALFGPTLAGAIRDATGGYFSAILLGAACMGASTLCCLLIREPPTRY